MEALEVQLLSKAVEPHLGTPSTTWNLIVFSRQHCFDRRCVHDWGVHIPRYWCMASFSPLALLWWGKMFIQHREWNWGADVCKEWLEHTLLPPSPKMFSSIRSSFQLITSPTYQCCCQSAQRGVNETLEIVGEGRGVKRGRGKGEEITHLLSDGLKFQTFIPPSWCGFADSRVISYVGGSVEGKCLQPSSLLPWKHH